MGTIMSSVCFGDNQTDALSKELVMEEVWAEVVFLVMSLFIAFLLGSTASG